jgi:hypothetical protein
MGVVFAKLEDHIPQWAEGWTLIQEVIVPNHDVTFFFAQSIPQLRENHDIKSLVTPRFSCRGLQTQNFGENPAVFWMRKGQLWKPISSDLFSFCSAYIYLFERFFGHLFNDVYYNLIQLVVIELEARI